VGGDAVFPFSSTAAVLTARGLKPELIPDPDKPKILATKAPRHKEKDFYKKLRVFVSWWRKSSS